MPEKKKSKNGRLVVSKELNERIRTYCTNKGIIMQDFVERTMNAKMREAEEN